MELSQISSLRAKNNDSRSKSIGYRYFYSMKFNSPDPIYSHRSLVRFPDLRHN
jgi:hypothetical protein